MVVFTPRYSGLLAAMDYSFSVGNTLVTAYVSVASSRMSNVSSFNFVLIWLRYLILLLITSRD